MVATNMRFVNGPRLCLPLAALVVLSFLPGPASGDESASAKPPATKEAAPAPRPAIAGVYAVEGSTAQVVVKGISGDVFFVSSSEGWEGVGFLDGSIYRGVFRRVDLSAMGEQTIDWSAVGSPIMQMTYTIRRAGEISQRWRRLDSPKAPAETSPPAPPAPGSRPKFGDYVYVEELPEVITKVAPVYPDEAGRIQGVVLVQALVIEDGTVAECKVVKSIPMLDEAAVACVRQWRFKPALTDGKPVAVWVAVPVRFPPQ
jgi:TonB family protein